MNTELTEDTIIFKTIWEPWSLDFNGIPRFLKMYETYEHWIYTVYMNFQIAWEAWSLDFQGTARFWKVYETYEHWIYTV